MRRFDRAVLALIQRLSTAMPYVDARGQRWQELAKGQEALLEVRSDAHAVSLSLAHATAAMRHAPEYAQAAEALRSDSDFKDASTSAGNWGTLDGLVNQIARQTGRMRRGGVVFDANHVLRVLAEIRKTLRASQIRYEVTARLPGLGIRQKHLALPGGYQLTRLNRKERNQRRRPMNPIFGFDWAGQQIASAPTEILLDLLVTVDHQEESALFRASNDAQQEATVRLRQFCDVVMLMWPGRVEYGDVRLEGGLRGLPSGQPLASSMPPSVSITIGIGDIDIFALGLDLVTQGPRSDRILALAVGRFLAGRRRTAASDKLVDFVVAWEALLLTQRKSRATQELSYRFAIHGATLLARIDRARSAREHYQKLKSAYSARSAMVHGETAKRLQKAVSAGGFSNVIELNEYLEHAFRLAAVHLGSLPPAQRPYRSDDGWPGLLWGNGDS